MPDIATNVPTRYDAYLWRVLYFWRAMRAFRFGRGLGMTTSGEN